MLGLEEMAAGPPNEAASSLLKCLWFRCHTALPATMLLLSAYPIPSHQPGPRAGRSAGRPIIPSIHVYEQTRAAQLQRTKLPRVMVLSRAAVLLLPLSPIDSIALRLGCGRKGRHNGRQAHDSSARCKHGSMLRGRGCQLHAQHCPPRWACSQRRCINQPIVAHKRPQDHL